MGKKIAQVLAVLIFLCGLGFLLYPKATEWHAAYENNKVMEDFEKDLNKLQNIATSDSEEDNTEKESIEDNSNEVSKEKLDKLYQNMESYNQQIYQEGQKNLKDPFAYEVPSFDLKEYGFQNNVIGAIEIPKMEVKLPLYLGASTKNMTKGAVILGETSMPVGGNNTNVVIAAHRGYKGIPMFREIETVETGDIIQITTPWNTLFYQVTEQKIVLPDEIKEILIQDEKDMITLLTCHPYTKNSHRYLVYAERCKKTVEDKNEKFKDNNSKEEEINYKKGMNSKEYNNGSKEENESERSQSEERIWLETYLPIIGGGIILLLIVLGILVTRKKR
ncbi:MAG: class C sortase [Lachnospiraceae bacterium]|nr:class C sortase [Lachnospiraceae bacterium]